MEYDGVSTWDHSSFDNMKNAMIASQDGLKIYSEPFVELFGIPLMYNHSITDPDLVRSFFNSDQEQGSSEVYGQNYDYSDSVFLSQNLTQNLRQLFKGTRTLGNGWILGIDGTLSRTH